MFFISKTKIYTVHINPSEANAMEKAIFVREGFNIIAFLFGMFWAVYHRMWFMAVGLAIIMAFFGAAEEQKWFDAASIAIIHIAFNFIIGFQANDLRRAHLSRRGYIMSDVVVSDNELSAQQRYFDRVLAA